MTSSRLLKLESLSRERQNVKIARLYTVKCGLAYHTRSAGSCHTPAPGLDKTVLMRLSSGGLIKGGLAIGHSRKEWCPMKQADLIILSTFNIRVILGSFVARAFGDVPPARESAQT